MHDKPDFTERIRRMARGGDDPVLRQHIDSCPECQEELKTLMQLERFRGLTGGDLSAISESQLSDLSGMLQKYRPDLGIQTQQTQSVVDRLRTLWAELLHDTGANPQLAGLRSGGNTATRQIAFVSDLADLDLEITEREDQLQIVGQLGMDEIPSGLSIKFVPGEIDPGNIDDADAIESEIDGEGYFSVQVESGTWTAALQVDDAVIVFPKVQL